VLRVLDLFSGIGGFSLGLERTGGFRTVAFCEIEPFPRKVLAKHWPDVPIFEDVRKLHAEDLPEPVDVICGGYPCQPFSIAGKRKGAEDDRHLWPEIARLLRELDAIRRKPAWCLFENVTGHVNLGLNQVLADLESQNYTAWPLIIPACARRCQSPKGQVVDFG
jgi:DNA (cytosine-5)-methyltransferase 1